MKQVANEKNKFLFEAISESVEHYGTDGLQFILLNLQDQEVIDRNFAEPSLHSLFLEINKAIELHGIDYVIYLIQNKKNLLSDKTLNLRHTKKMNDMVFDTVCRIFETNKNNILNENKRDGKRIDACGTAIKIFFEILDYTIHDVMKIIPRKRSVIYKYRTRIDKLDHNHPQESDTFKKFFFCKHEIIKFILNQEDGR